MQMFIKCDKICLVISVSGEVGCGRVRKQDRNGIGERWLIKEALHNFVEYSGLRAAGQHTAVTCYMQRSQSGMRERKLEGW